MIGWIKVGVVAGECTGGMEPGLVFASDAHGGEDAQAVVEEALRDEAEALGVEIDGYWVKQQMWRILQLYQEALERSPRQRERAAGFVYQMELPSGRTLLMGEPVVLDQVNLLH